VKPTLESVPVPLSLHPEQLKSKSSIEQNKASIEYRKAIFIGKNLLLLIIPPRSKNGWIKMPSV
jgi:hypothetical protein